MSEETEGPDPEKEARIEALRATLEGGEEISEDDEKFLEEVAADPRYKVSLTGE
jgi:hypothetical protein